jgi:hypothetical protein
MPGPGSGIPEHEYPRNDRERQELSPCNPDRLVAEGARVFAVVFRCIKDHTAILDEEAEELARAVADVHTTTIHRRRR